MKRAFPVLVVLLLGATQAMAQSASDVSAVGAEGRRWSLQSGLGFTAGPDTFLMGFEADYRMSDNFSVGASLQLGLDDVVTLVSPTGYVRYSFDLEQMGSGETWGRLTPFVQGGLGLTYIDLDIPSFLLIDDDDIGFLMNFGFGAEYSLSNSMSLGSRMLFNVIPTKVFGDTFYFSWEVATLRYRF
jgi:opacity protein-like surface antigen